jgi:5-methylcytosine-specific restriction enzyme subunit McrC
MDHQSKDSMNESQSIPVQNLYYLLCYAWDRLDQAHLIDVSAAASDAPVDFFALVLIKGIEHLKRRGLNTVYRSTFAELPGVRGRIDVIATERRFLLRQGRSACSFDELTTDTTANRILKSTLRLIASDPEINKEIRSHVHKWIRDFATITDVPASPHNFRTVHLDRNSSFYRFLLNVCELILTVRIPEETGGRLRFRDFIRDKRKMAYVFQYFVYNFLRIERSDLMVQRENITWKVDPLPNGIKSLLPMMQTDISVAKNGRKVIIDTKYYSETLSDHFGGKRIHSDHLYQMLSYLMNAKAPGESIEGLLLYPFVDKTLKERYRILGVDIRVETLNLAQPWNLLHSDLMQLVPL